MSESPPEPDWLEFEEIRGVGPSPLALAFFVVTLAAGAGALWLLWF